MDFTEIKFWFSLVQSLMTFGVIITLFIMRGRLTTRKDLEGLNVRLSVVEQQMESVKKIDENLAKVIISNARIEGELVHINRSLDDIKETERRRS